MTNSSKAAKPARKRMAIFRAADAKPLEIKEFAGVDATVMEKMAFQSAAMQQGVMPEDTKVVFSGGGVSLTHAWFKSGHIVPRHSHNADCLYYILSGELLFGTQVLKAGDGMFVPADDGYTIQAGERGAVFLEFRTSETYNMEFKNNDDAHYQKMADSFRDNAERWASETRPTENL